ncbi:MAG: hypothetical protein LBL26_04850 [Peptococcaceae bacterium]|jgi:hypothetical protein|nr:hypothetical protein [Peptococcaceae bacterium]
MPRRETSKLFDLTLKRLLNASSRAIVYFVNGLFGTCYPPDSVVDYPLTEYISSSLKSQMLDILLLINKTDLYHIEAQIDDDGNMAIRVFDYGYAVGLHYKQSEDDIIRIKFPDARVIYWETSRKTPDYVTLRLEFPDGTVHDYKVQSFKYLDHDLEDLEKQKMIILLPFYLLKYRKRIKTSVKKRAELAAEVKQLLDDTVRIVHRSAQAGVITREDAGIIIACMDHMFVELYGSQYKEFKEANEMLQGALVTSIDKAVEKTRLEDQEKYEQEREKYEQRFRSGFQNMLKNGMTPEQIANMFDMPVEDIVKIKSDCESQK